jgi:hypothetical protein
VKGLPEEDIENYEIKTWHEEHLKDDSGSEQQKHRIHALLTLALDEVSSQLHALITLSLQKRPH